ncbi:unnamed protein product [Closterium sp. NIES-54]
MDLAVSVRALARESGIHRKCLTNWKRTAEFLKDVHSARKRMHGRGRASWYRPMELKVYKKLLEWHRKGTAVSVGRLQEWSREFMKLLYPGKKCKGSQRWSERFRRRWNLSVRMKNRVAQKTAAHVAEQCKSFWQFVRAKRRERGIDTAWIINADQTPLWLEMPATTTVEETGVRSMWPWLATRTGGWTPLALFAGLRRASVWQTRQELDAGAGFLPRSPHQGGEGEAPRDELRAGDHPVGLYGGGTAARCLHQQEL